MIIGVYTRHKSVSTVKVLYNDRFYAMQYEVFGDIDAGSLYFNLRQATYRFEEDSQKSVICLEGNGWLLHVWRPTEMSITVSIPRAILEKVRHYDCENRSVHCDVLGVD